MFVNYTVSVGANVVGAFIARVDAETFKRGLMLEYGQTSDEIIISEVLAKVVNS